ncbi:hypothetical protein EH164_04015 [Kosakonia sp. CCTCC M2018092]|nr:hypothetical protein EH164_04015 [Kosakonia sp. CCTCC M2018092]
MRKKLLFVIHWFSASNTLALRRFVMIVTLRILALMKDRAEPNLSTDYATNLGTFCAKIRFCSRVKAVNGNSSRGYSHLSHFSVDNRV